MEFNKEYRVSSLEPVEDSATFGENVQEMVKAKILHTLHIYPKLSMTMLQVGIGTGISPDIWHPVLEQLIVGGTVDKRQITAKTPKGRDQVYTIVELKLAA